MIFVYTIYFAHAESSNAFNFSPPVPSIAFIVVLSAMQIQAIIKEILMIGDADISIGPRI